MPALDEAGGLGARQQALVAALTSSRGDAIGVSGVAALAGIEGGAARGLQAYRLNAQALSAKALGAVFGQLREALGEQEFEAMAWAFWRQAPPRHGDLALWGGGLADFLAAQEGMDAALHELAELARLEWALHEAERAADAELETASLELLASLEPAQIGLRMRPGVALLQRQGAAPLLVWRKGWRACSMALAGGDAALMRCLLEGRDLASALAAASAADDVGFDFSAWLQAALGESWLQAAVNIRTSGDGP